MHILIVQHVLFEGAGQIADWAASRGHRLRYHYIFEAGSNFPVLNDIDMLVIMGGPMGVNDTHLPWIAPEKSFLKAAIAAGKYVVGICLGAQLIASALGANIYRNPVKEIGWFPVRKTANHPLILNLPMEDVFHWHGDTFDLPEGATLLFSTDACRHQGFIYNDRVLALQFHLEMTAIGILDLIEHCGNELIPSPTIQTEEMLQTGLRNAPSCFIALYTLLDRLTQANPQSALM